MESRRLRRAQNLRRCKHKTAAHQLTKAAAGFTSVALAQMAELVDALVSGTSAARRGGSSPLLGTIYPLMRCFSLIFLRQDGDAVREEERVKLPGSPVDACRNRGGAPIGNSPEKSSRGRSAARSRLSSYEESPECKESFRARRALRSFGRMRVSISGGWRPSLFMAVSVRPTCLACYGRTFRKS
jgi:hypothetical protein